MVAINKLLTILVLFATFVAKSEAFYDKRIFNDSYCGNIAPNSGQLHCCLDRMDECNRVISNGRDTSLCYCDAFCREHHVNDCCPDYEDVCHGRATTTDSGGTTRDKGTDGGLCYREGDKCVKGCNQCTCYYGRWKCDTDPCMNDEDLIRRVNTGHHGWIAGTYPKFNGIKVKDGMTYFLGTIYPKSKTFQQCPVSSWHDALSVKNPNRFDARINWHCIQPAADQGRCGASWAFAAASVATDRWCVQSRGRFEGSLAPQQLISCSKFVRSQDSCIEGGYMEDAWSWITEKGLVKENCYPYTSGKSEATGECTEPRWRCKSFTHQTTPLYRMDNDAWSIMGEIETNGPVHAIMKVKADFFQYKSGVYGYTREPESMSCGNFEGYHSVKIIGWDCENGVNYWLAMNSWGPEWGDNGTFKIKRGDNESGIEEFVVAAYARLPHFQRWRHRGRIDSVFKR